MIVKDLNSLPLFSGKGIWQRTLAGTAALANKIGIVRVSVSPRVNVAPILLSVGISIGFHLFTMGVIPCATSCPFLLTMSLAINTTAF